MKSRLVLLTAAAVCGALTFAPVVVLAQEKVVATVNGRSITEAELKLADAEIGSDLGTLPEATKRRVLVEYLIENHLFADAADGQKLGQGANFDQRMAYWRRRALRDTYFDTTVRKSVTEADAKRLYDAEFGQAKGQEEVRASHILVKSREKAVEIFERIAHGADFTQMARQFSEDPGSKEMGGSLGYFGRGQMVPQFEATAFKLKKGEVSEPVQSQFGWHLIRLDDRRVKSAPPFEEVKERIIASMMHQKAQSIGAELRNKAKVDYVDPEMKAMVEAEKQQRAPGKR